MVIKTTWESHVILLFFKWPGKNMSLSHGIVMEIKNAACVHIFNLSLLVFTPQPLRLWAHWGIHMWGSPVGAGDADACKCDNFITR